MEAKKSKQQPKKVEKINCKTCGELLLKVYPWAGVRVQGAQVVIDCRKEH